MLLILYQYMTRERERERETDTGIRMKSQKARCVVTLLPLKAFMLVVDMYFF